MVGVHVAYFLTFKIRFVFVRVAKIYTLNQAFLKLLEVEFLF